jgi:hypothetical protein
LIDPAPFDPIEVVRMCRLPSVAVQRMLTHAAREAA